VSPTAIGWIVLTCVFGGAMLGMVLRRVLPENHLSTESKDVIKLGMALTSTMSALVLALLISSAKSSYDAQRNEITQMSANIILLDRVLAHYGPETKEARELLSSSVAGMADRIWPGMGTGPKGLELSSAGAEAFYDSIQELSPQNEVQRALQAQALKMSIDIGQTRWLLFEQSGRSIPMPFLVLLIFWVTIIFLSFGLFSPPNATVIATLFLCALSVSGAIFMIMELDRPFGGLIQISSAPLRNAITHIGK
jgi:UDP-N-acetylmuramyl pentapeptide phosphotransferase/UDP-N-acetylglucosamine-1-phosphate transferase